MEEPTILDMALEAADAGNAGHWPTVAGIPAQEYRKLHAALTDVLIQTGGINVSHIGQDRAFAIAREALKGSGTPRRLAGLKFDVGEHVWVVGPRSYLTGPIPVGTVPNWGDLWFVSNQVKIVGIRLIDDKLYYVFPGGGDDSGSRMFRSKDEAELCVSNHNSKSTPN